MAPEVRALIGDFADAVDNRSLLFEKFSLPKVWGQENDRKLDDAGRWSVLRIVTRGADLLNRDAANLQWRAQGRNVEPRNAERMEYAADMARKLAKVARPDSDLARRCADNGKKFLDDLNAAYPNRVATFEATLGARLMVNMAGGVVENAGIALDRCFGLPFLPGSAVKGITRSQALWEIRDADESAKPHLLRLALLIFGFGKHDIKPKGDFAWAAGPGLARDTAAELKTEEFKGSACFLPAYPTSEPTLVVDMVNPHYPEYYRGRRSRATDDENPIPNYFPAVEAGAVFGFAVLLNRVPEGAEPAALLAQARRWVEQALTVKGAGAKTAAGYGWFTLGRKDPPPSHAPTIAAQGASATPRAASPGQPPAAPVDPLLAELRGLLKTPVNFAVGIPKLAAINDDTELRRLFEAAVPEAERRKLRKNQPYWQSFTSGCHGEAGKKTLQRLGIKLA